MEIRVNGHALAVTMRTPGHDWDLAVGFLIGEGVITHDSAVREIRYCAGAVDGVNTYNVVDVQIDHPTLPASIERNFAMTSACGVCGKASLDAVRVQSVFDLHADTAEVDPEVLVGLPGKLRDQQQVFAATGGLHGAGLFTMSGEPLLAREDVGRHNAVDKVIGASYREGRWPLHEVILMVSGRASFELVQKAVVAGIPVLAAVSAPSSLAVELAEESGMTLVGFLRGDSMNVYSGAHRINATPPS